MRPDQVRNLADLCYPATLNLAAVLVDAHIAAGRGHRTALVAGSTRVNYRELQDQVRVLAGGLRSAGCVPGDRILIRLSNNPDLVALWLATQMIGAVVVATSPMLRARELRAIIEDAGPSLVITAPEGSNDVGSALAGMQNSPRMLSIGAASSTAHVAADSLEALAANSAPVRDAHRFGTDDVALIAYTVGADGQWKGACHSPADVLASADTYARRVLELRDNDIVGGHPPMTFTYGLGALLVFPLRFCSTSVLTEGFDAEALLATIGREGITVFFGTATCYRLLMRVPGFSSRFNLRSLRLCVSAGEPLAGELSAEWKAATGVDLLDGLGTTELFHVVVSQRPGRVRHGSIGVAVPGYELRVVDADMRELPDGTPGRLAVRGPTSCCYWNRGSVTRQFAADGWTLTGDLVTRDAEGHHWFLRRADDLIVSAGYNIAGPEVEAVLLQHPAVAAAAVVAVADPTRGAVPKAFVVLNSPASPGTKLVQALHDHMVKGVATYKCPRQIEFVLALPMTPTGEIDRAVLRARSQTGT